MTTATMSTFFALLAFVAAAGAGVGALVLVTGGGRGVQWAMPRRALADQALWLGAAVATVTTLGSLYYSLVAHYEPCELCWYQRICMYPLSVMLLLAAWRRDRGIWRYAAPLAGIGAVIAAYHTQLQAFPAQRTFCDIDNPCTARYVWEFGFVSLPLMALVAFAFVIVMVLLARTRVEGAAP